jgi:hypothetical protein
MAQILRQRIEPGRTALIDSARREGGRKIVTLELTHAHPVDVVEAVAASLDIEQQCNEQDGEEEDALMR